MSREVRRVPLDFDYPLGKTWSGYLMPADLREFPACLDCTYRLFPSEHETGSGLTREAYAISQSFYPHMIGGPMADLLAWHDKLGQAEVDYLIEKGRLRDYTERWNVETRTWEPRGVPVTAAMVNAGQHPHDAINRAYLVEFRCQQLGIEKQCPTCNGHGDIAAAEQREAAENWVGMEPPTGPGYQLWETVSEGSPVSPVFASPPELADWIIANGRMVSGVQAAAEAAAS